MDVSAPVGNDDGRLDCRFVAGARSVASLEDDLRQGLLTPPRVFPPKYFYDERGSHLFDRICETPEYYLTRTEDALLSDSAERIIAAAEPDDILEIGSGMSRKTLRLLDACEAASLYPSYSPFDISEDALRLAAEQLLQRYPWLRVSLLVGDYDAGLANLPGFKDRRLICFLGSTIGNLEHGSAVAFLEEIRHRMSPGDSLLLGADRVKPAPILNAAYNDDDGLTAAFNMNLLSVLNTEADCDFEPGKFSHRAAFNAELSRIEMHLISQADQEIRIGSLDTTIQIERGEAILTEISRKFTVGELQSLLGESGFDIEFHFTPGDNAFSLVLARPRDF
ncbi:MAG: L-histidine N(alpha)-methyltransferase [Alphaproteobacteria bacterium]|jgi:L-histidine N-alpha-methyltransferase|nr:L-histidine N(alpha)-methyltransferase [Alphaproteobacteria bacterium]